MRSLQNLRLGLAVALFAFLYPGAAFPEMIVRTTGGRVIRVDVNRNEVRSIEFVEESAPSSRTLSGTWNVKFDGRTTTTLTLQQSGTSVTGTLHTTDNSAGAVTGRLTGETLELSRDSGLQTIQHYKVTVKGDQFSGTYWNEGRYAGRGSFEGSRR